MEKGCQMDSPTTEKNILAAWQALWRKAFALVATCSPVPFNHTMKIYITLNGQSVGPFHSTLDEVNHALKCAFNVPFGVRLKVDRLPEVGKTMVLDYQVRLYRAE